MNSPVADKICTGEFFYVTGNFVEFSDKVKALRAGFFLTESKTKQVSTIWFDGQSGWRKKDRKSGKKTWNCGEKSGRIRVVWKTFRKKG